MQTPSFILTKRIEEVAPISGVSIGNIQDKSTWKVHFKDNATEEHIKYAMEIISLFDYGKEEKESNESIGKRNEAFEKLLQYFENNCNGVICDSNDRENSNGNTLHAIR